MAACRPRDPKTDRLFDIVTGPCDLYSPDKPAKEGMFFVSYPPTAALGASEGESRGPMRRT